MVVLNLSFALKFWDIIIHPITKAVIAAKKNSSRCNVFYVSNFGIFCWVDKISYFFYGSVKCFCSNYKANCKTLMHPLSCREILKTNPTTITPILIMVCSCMLGSFLTRAMAPTIAYLDASTRFFKKAISIKLKHLKQLDN